MSIRGAMIASHLVPPVGEQVPRLDLSHSRPQSVRDQMVRAQTVVQIGVEQGLIKPGRVTKRLVVVGAGAAGATAALTALDAGVHTTLVHNAPDRNDAFGLQRLSPRFLDPTIYDWPAPQWRELDWGREVAMLPWSSGRAADIVNRYWQPAWELAVNRHFGGLLEIASPRDLHQHVDRGTPASIRLSGQLVRAGLVVECIGPGEERVWLGGTAEAGGFRGFAYWDETDPVARQDYRLPAGQRAIVSGGGDGALQEFLWLATGVTGRTLAEALPLDMFAAAGREVEDQYQREYVWLSADNFERRDHDVLTSWHRAWTTLVANILGDTSRAARLKRALDPFLRDEPPVDLAFSCDHFGYCFALNRLLVLLVDRLLLEKFGRSHLYSGLAVTNCEGRGHACTAPIDCHGRPHEVKLSARGCRDVGHVGSPTTLAADVVVIRHGIVSNQNRRSMPVPRQMVAYAPRR